MPAALVPALRAQAWVERSRLDNRQAKDLLDEAVRLARRHHLDGELREVLLTRAAVNHELGRLIPAQRDLDGAAKLSPSRGAAELAFQQAVLYMSLGKLSRAASATGTSSTTPDAPAVVKSKAANNYAIISPSSVTRTRASAGRTRGLVPRGGAASDRRARLHPSLDHHPDGSAHPGTGGVSTKRRDCTRWPAYRSLSTTSSTSTP